MYLYQPVPAGRLPYPEKNHADSSARSLPPHASQGFVALPPGYVYAPIPSSPPQQQQGYALVPAGAAVPLASFPVALQQPPPPPLQHHHPGCLPPSPAGYVFAALPDALPVAASPFHAVPRGVPVPPQGQQGPLPVSAGRARGKGRKREGDVAVESPHRPSSHQPSTTATATAAPCAPQQLTATQSTDAPKEVRGNSQAAVPNGSGGEHSAGRFEELPNDGEGGAVAPRRPSGYRPGTLYQGRVKRYNPLHGFGFLTATHELHPIADLQRHLCATAAETDVVQVDGQYYERRLSAAGDIFVHHHKLLVPTVFDSEEDVVATPASPPMPTPLEAVTGAADASPAAAVAPPPKAWTPPSAATEENLKRFFRLFVAGAAVRFQCGLYPPDDKFQAMNVELLPRQGTLILTKEEKEKAIAAAAATAARQKAMNAAAASSCAEGRETASWAASPFFSPAAGAERRLPAFTIAVPCSRKPPSSGPGGERRNGVVEGGADRGSGPKGSHAAVTAVSEAVHPFRQANSMPAPHVATTGSAAAEPAEKRDDDNDGEAEAEAVEDGIESQHSFSLSTYEFPFDMDEEDEEDAAERLFSAAFTNFLPPAAVVSSSVPATSKAHPSAYLNQSSLNLMSLHHNTDAQTMAYVYATEAPVSDRSSLSGGSHSGNKSDATYPSLTGTLPSSRTILREEKSAASFPL